MASMDDTQWPRFQVYLQPKEGAPYQDVGSVHAPDIELALLNARDVFLRRPEGISLWVVPANAITTCTQQELQNGKLEDTPTGEQETSSPPGSGKRVKAGERRRGEKEVYHVFQKRQSAGLQQHVGAVEAASPGEALELGVERYAAEKPAFVWSVFPARFLLASTPDDYDSMFAPAATKNFRLSTDYPTLSMMRQLMAKWDHPRTKDE
jgi:ring-1,2-phenylacetyl-CoA epoxidase subunit PaaB